MPSLSNGGGATTLTFGKKESALLDPSKQQQTGAQERITQCHKVTHSASHRASALNAGQAVHGTDIARTAVSITVRSVSAKKFAQARTLRMFVHFAEDLEVSATVPNPTSYSHVIPLN